MSNPLFDFRNASSYRRPSDVDQWDWVQIRDIMYTGQVPTKPMHLNFRSNDVQNLYFWQEARLIVKFKVDVPAGDADPTQPFADCTVKSDLRSWMRHAQLDINGVNVEDHNNVDVWGVYDRAQYSEGYYKNVAREWLCDDIPPDANAISTVGGYIQPTAGPGTWFAPSLPAEVAGNAVPLFGSHQDNGFARRFQLTNISQGDGPNAGRPGLAGRIITAAIPLKMIYPFMRYLNVVLKNCQWEFKMCLHDMTKAAHFLEYGAPGDDALEAKFTPANGLLVQDYYIEVPRVVPSPPTLIAVNDMLLNNPTVSVTYPNWQCYNNTIRATTAVQEFMVDNSVDRLVRYTALMIPKRWDSYAALDARRSVHNALNNFTLMVNGTRIPQSEVRSKFSEGPLVTNGATGGLTVLGGGSALAANVASDAGRADRELDVHTLYRLYLELCQNGYLNNCNETDGRYVMPYRNSGHLSLQEFAFLNPFVTLDLSKSAQNSEFIGGMSQITTRLEFDQAPPEECWLYSIVEFEQRVSISLSERAAFVETKLTENKA